MNNNRKKIGLFKNYLFYVIYCQNVYLMDILMVDNTMGSYYKGFKNQDKIFIEKFR